MQPYVQSQHVLRLTTYDLLSHVHARELHHPRPANQDDQSRQKRLGEDVSGDNEACRHLIPGAEVQWTLVLL